MSLFIKANITDSHITKDDMEEKSNFECKHIGCGQKFKKNISLKNHMHLHFGTHPFKCEFEGCGLRFVGRNTFLKHQKTHSVERPFVCTYEGCKKNFKTRGGLTDHAIRHTGVKRFTCDQCKKQFYRKQDLKAH